MGVNIRCKVCIISEPRHWTHTVSPGFKSWPRDPLVLMTFSWFCSASQAVRDLFLPRPFQFIIE